VLGVSVPDLRSIASEVRRDTSGWSAERILQLAQELVGRGIHEERQVAWELIAQRPDVFPLLNWRSVESLGRGNDNWASVDAFSVLVAGPAWRQRRISDARVRRWAISPDPWWRRTALVSTVALNLKSRGGSGDPERTLDICHVLADDPNPMVAKALSWALRALVPHDPVGVRTFLRDRGDVIAGRVAREVSTKLETGRK
jgi:3-methyladenine DNA glycosylase AlkD